jgi:hypothetical protein
MNSNARFPLLLPAEQVDMMAADELQPPRRAIFATKCRRRIADLIVHSELDITVSGRQTGLPR